MFLGIDERSGLAYEGVHGVELPAVPNPIVTPAKLIESHQDWSSLPLGVGQHPISWMFREDTFDAVTRIRRGRLYEPQSGGQRLTFQVFPHPNVDPMGLRAGPTGRRAVELYVYTACFSLLSKPRQGEGTTLALGTTQGVSVWRIIQTEVLANRCVMVTLKSLSAFGILPTLDTSKVPKELRVSVAEALGHALDAAFRETPISVIDRCRNALTVLLSHWMVSEGFDHSILGADLGKVATEIAKPPLERKVISWQAQVVARLHSRGKNNEVHSKGLRIPVEEDAELALQALGFAMRDTGWAT